MINATLSSCHEKATEVLLVDVPRGSNPFPSFRFFCKRLTSNQIVPYTRCYAKACSEYEGPARFRVIAPCGNTASFEEMSQWWRVVATLCWILPAWDLNFRPSAPETKALPLDLLAVDVSHVNFLLVQSCQAKRISVLQSTRSK